MNVCLLHYYPVILADVTRDLDHFRPDLNCGTQKTRQPERNQRRCLWAKELGVELKMILNKRPECMNEREGVINLVLGFTAEGFS